MTKQIIAGALFVSVSMLATPVFAQNPTTASPATGTPVRQQPVDLSCMQAAVERRDNAMIAALSNFHAAAKKALEMRRDALKAAWTNTDRKARKEAQRMAWEAYKKAVRDARAAFKKAQRVAWDQFAADRKTCRGQGEDMSNPGVDANL